MLPESAKSGNKEVLLFLFFFFSTRFDSPQMDSKRVLLASLASLARIAMETDRRPIFFKLAATRPGFQTAENIS